MPEVIIVDEKDKEIAREEKLKAHQEGKLHRAFSVLIFNSKGEMLIQKRTKSKYHSGGLWSNACCSHPRTNQNISEEAKERLKEEMGFSTELKEIFSFIYKIKLGDLFEYEFDHVLVGKFDGIPVINPEEAEDWKWIDFEELKKDARNYPENYSYWFKIILESDKINVAVNG